MAKLNVLVPAVDVEVIGVGGSRTKYRKVERDAKAGDILKITDNSGDGYVVEGAFYEVKYLDCAEDPQILDEDGEEMDTAGMRFEVYEKVAESPALVADEITFEGDKYRKVGRDAKEGDVIKITEPDDEDDPITVGGLYRIESVDWNGDPQITDNDGNEFDTCGSTYEVYEKVTVQYREVKRPAKVGERIKIVDAQMAGGDYENGDEMVVTETRWPTSHAVNADFNGNQVHVWYAEYVVLEPIAEKPELKRLTVGDYAKVVSNIGYHNYAIGSVVKITKDDFDRQPYRAEKPDGTIGNYLHKDDVVPATEAEFLAQKAALAPSFKVGDFVKVVDASGDYRAKDGDIGEVTRIDDKFFRDEALITVKTLDGRVYAMYAKRFVRATESEVAAAKQALKFGDFEDGDYAQIVNATRDNASLDARNNADKFVTVTREVGPYRVFGLRLLSDGKLAGYANADALRKVTKEEYEAATDPRNQFAKGDKVRLISGGGGPGLNGYENGGVYTVGRTTGAPGGWSDRVEVNGSDKPVGFAKPEQLEKLSAGEVAEIDRKKAEETKWAAIGRKVNEFKPGDLVEATRRLGDKGRIYGEFLKGPDGSGAIAIKTADGDFRSAELETAILIAPVEQRFDRTEAA
ncbi:hypothetical protein P4H42_03755 [Paenibacillus macerans]|uniref:hypothetical protein n=1 Tax=Paenibacillus macerans TaxID=44252 RepID=UPI002DB87A0A|nr:hypothetical protein [Paenibacillus macerans]MEC0328738.1 hypothetical protein [Paenibacillus macerans]